MPDEKKAPQRADLAGRRGPRWGLTIAAVSVLPIDHSPVVVPGATGGASHFARSRFQRTRQGKGGAPSPSARALRQATATVAVAAAARGAGRAGRAARTNSGRKVRRSPFGNCTVTELASACTT